MEIRSFTPTQTRGSADAELPLPVPRVPDLSGRILGARYSLRRRIGGGSMGTVYEARDMTLGTAVAVKVMHPEYSHDEAFRKRFHQEALIGARLRHEHSVAVTDLGQSDDGLLFSVMEYLEGESLDALLGARSTPLPWRRVVLIANQVCAALQAAHDRGIIHRDIKPGNCFLVRHEGPGDDDPQPSTFIKVLDLGLARIMPVSGRPTPPGRLGAPEYLAPEQIQGSLCDHRVDLYALGVMMYVMLTGRLPFVGDNPSAVMKAHLEEPPPSLRRVAPDAEIPEILEAVVVRALAKDPAGRFPSATAMAEAIAVATIEAEASDLEDEEDEPLASSSGLSLADFSAASISGASFRADASATSGASFRTDSGADSGLRTDSSAGAGATGNTWRRAAPPPTVPTMKAVSAMTTLTSMVLAPDYGYGPSTRGGLVVLALAFAGICVAVTALWTSNRLLLAPAAEAAPLAATPIAAREATQPTAHVSGPERPPVLTPPRRRSIDLRPLGPVEHVPVPEEVVDLSAPPWADPELATNPDPLPEPTDSLDEAAAPEPTRLVRRSPPGAFLPRARPQPPAGPQLPPGFPTERTFRRLADSVAPGVHRCMRTHSAELASLTVELTIGGPRRSAVEMTLKEADTPALRACIAPLLARVAFPASERTARYAFTYKP
jgi:serine/threonine protein kinase